MSRVYLDYNATTPLRPEAKVAMVAAMEVTGNPSSVHAEGRKAKAIVEYRTKHGPFRSVDDLSLVKGIGERTVDKNRTDIQVSTPKKK